MIHIKNENLNIVYGPTEGINEFLARHIDSVMEMNGGKIVLGTAGGSSTQGIYDKMKSIGMDLTRITAFTPDEFLGTEDQQKSIQKALPGATVHSPYAYFPSDRHQDVLESEYEKLGYGTSEYLLGIKEACQYYERKISHVGGIDIMLLGLGMDPDGHVASIMPGDIRIDDRTHLERYLTPHKTSQGNTMYAITMGLGTILEAREIFVLAFGEKKKDIVHKMIYGEKDSSFPASYLKGIKGKTHMIADYGSAQMIPGFKETFAE